jgi:hypothetical protein
MKTTIDMAREAGFKHDTKGIIWTEDRDGDCTEELKAFETLVRADERAAPVQEVSWGVDWGKAGDKSCSMIIKRLPDGKIEVVAVEYEP